MSTVAVIPVKQLANAKQRLSGVLSAEQRRDLFRAMLEDVLEAATSCDRVEKVIVVTDDAEVADIAHAFGAETRPEPGKPGLIEAVAETGRQLANESVERMVFLPADIPLVSVEELEVVLDGPTGEGPDMMIVPAHDLGGSNCVVTAPPDCMPFAFGVDSFRRHLDIARDLGIEPSVARLPGIGLDIDTPDDLFEMAGRLEQAGLETNTHRFLLESGIMGALKPAAGA